MAMKRSTQTTENKWLIPLLVVVFFALGAIFSIGGYSYGRFVSILIVGIACLLDLEDLLCLILFSLPFASMLKLSSESISILPILYLVFLLKLLGKGRLSISPLSLLLFFLLTIFQATTIFLYGANYTSIIALLLNVAFVMFASSYFRSNENVNPHILVLASLCFCIGTVEMLLLNDLFPQLPYLIDANRQTTLEAANRYAASMLDPNELTQIILIALALLVAILPSIETKGGKFFTFVMMIYVAITGVRTNSKSYVLTLAGLFVFLMFLLMRTLAKKQGTGRAILLLIPFLLITLVGCVLLVIYVILPVFESRSNEQTDLLTNRGNIWSCYIETLFSRPDIMLIGCGGGNVTGLLRMADVDATFVPHNAYLEYWIQFGALGLGMLVVVWKNALSAIKEKLNTYYILALIAFLITAFAISVNDNDCLFVLLALLSLPRPANTDGQLIEVRKTRRECKYIKSSKSF